MVIFDKQEGFIFYENKEIESTTTDWKNFY